jgi:hypothetical protein
MVVVPEDIVFSQPEPDWSEFSQPGQQRIAATNVARPAVPARNMPDNVWVYEILDRPKVAYSKCVRCLAIRRGVRMFLAHISNFRLVEIHACTLAWTRRS